MKNIFTRIKLYIVAHKIISSVVLIIVLFGGYTAYKKSTATTGEVRYVMGTATTGTIISSITGSGQVSASNQVDIKPTVSGAITYVGVRPGDRVGSGQTLFIIDNTSAQKAVRDAEISLQSAQISFDKLKTQNSDANLNADLTLAYDNAFTAVSDTFSICQT